MSKLEIFCSVCVKSFSIQDPYDSEDLQVNARAVLATRTAVCGRAGLAAFTGMVEMVLPLTSKHYPQHKKVLVATQDVADAEIMAAAALLRKDAAEEEVVDVKVTVDATWQTHGNHSLYGVFVVASWETGELLDIEVLNKYFGSVPSA